MAVRLIKHRPVPGRASADLLRDFLMFLALVRQRMMSGRAPYRWNRTIFFLYKNRPVPVRCVQTPAERRCHFTLNDTTKRRTGAVEF